MCERLQCRTCDDTQIENACNLAAHLYSGMGDVPPMIGRTISHSRVVEKVDGGGMGVVFKAEDLNLGPLVGLKFLPEDLARAPHWLARFRREAQATSALNHLKICAIYDLLEEEGLTILVMELFDGMTLQEQLSSGRLELQTLLEQRVEITDALDAVHASRVVHRNFKTANIFVTRREHAKVLDFGLAKLTFTGSGGGESDLTAPTQSIPLIASVARQR